MLIEKLLHERELSAYSSFKYEAYSCTDTWFDPALAKTDAVYMKYVFKNYFRLCGLDAFTGIAIARFREASTGHIGRYGQKYFFKWLSSYSSIRFSMNIWTCFYIRITLVSSKTKAFIFNWSISGTWFPEKRVGQNYGAIFCTYTESVGCVVL